MATSVVEDDLLDKTGLLKQSECLMQAEQNQILSCWFKPQHPCLL